MPAQFRFWNVMLRISSLGSILLFAAMTSTIGGCLSDPTNILQVRPETVLAPGNPSFRAVNYVQYSSPPSGQMLVRWNRSIADTQLNFKGYIIELWKSDTNVSANNSLGGEEYTSLLDSIQVFKVSTKIPDTFCTFPSRPGTSLPLGRYTIVIWGVKTADTIYKSVDSSTFSALFSPQPLQNPTNLRATSVSPTQVLLRWTDPVTSHDTGFWQYVIYYRDTTKSNDTGHFATSVRKGTVLAGGDSTALVPVPGSNLPGSTTPEWPYEFWVKSERIDSTFFYGPDLYGPDTNHVIWAGAEQVPKTNFDSTHSGYLLVPADSAIYFGSYNGQYDVAINHTANTAQLSVTISGGIVTLHAQSPNGVGFYNGPPEPADSLALIFYTIPRVDPTQFTSSSVSLPPSVNDTGVIVYLMMNDDITPQLGHKFARIFIRKQADGTFDNTSSPVHAPNGGIDIQASFQPGVTKDGSRHLPFY